MAEPTYTASELARLAALGVRGGMRVQRGKSTARIDAQIEAIRQEAIQREAAEKAARESEKQRKVQERAARRAKSMWW